MFCSSDVKISEERIVKRSRLKKPFFFLYFSLRLAAELKRTKRTNAFELLLH
jgi:hypothetical protein